MGNVRFPNESPEYRAARDALTQAETELTRRIEAVAEQRRQLPPGGEVPEDYVFTERPAGSGAERPGRQVRLSELFAGHDALLLYSFMFSPHMSQPCPMCTSLLDALDGAAPDLAQRAGFAVVAKSPIDRLRSYARERGWVNLRVVSSAGTSYNRDYHGENEDQQLSRMNVFSRRGGVIRHFYATEQTPAAPGWDDRHVDLIWPLWNLLDLTPEGRGRDWRPEDRPRAHPRRGRGHRPRRRTHPDHRPGRRRHPHHPPDHHRPGPPGQGPAAQPAPQGCPCFLGHLSSMCWDRFVNHQVGLDRS
jgi:predicted dithiol-disulfide oxidoreductase (DUF899 family)